MSDLSNLEPRTPETSAAYVRAVLELVGDRDPLSILGETPARIIRVLDGVPQDALYVEEEPGKWSVAQVVQHLADSELVWGCRLRRILAETRPALHGYDQDEWSVRLGYDEVELEDAMDLFVPLRRSNLRLLRRAGPEEMDRTAVHAERGEADLSTLIRLNAGHDLAHLRQIERIRARVTGETRAVDGSAGR